MAIRRGKEKKGTFWPVGRPPRLQFSSLWVLSSLTTVSVVANLPSGFYLRCYLCRTSRFFQFLHSCLCQQSGLVKSLPVIRDFSTTRSLLLSLLRRSGSRSLGAADGNQIVENSRSVCRRLVGLALCLVCNCGKGRDSRRRPLLDNCTLVYRPNPAAPTKPTVIPSQATQSPDLLKQFRP